MANIIEIRDFSAPELDVYARLTENQLVNRADPENGLFVAESPLVIERALDGGMNLIDTARAYSDSEEKIGRAIAHRRREYTLATKTGATTPEGFRRDLDTSLRLLKTDHIDIYQFHCAGQCYRPDDGTGMYECMLEAKRQGKILHIAATAHKIGIAEEMVDSGLYECMQFPFSYLAGERDIALVERCKRIVCQATGANYETATRALEECGFRAKVAIVMLRTGSDARKAEQLLAQHEDRVASAIGED